jgi:hypothetical protein
LLHTPHQSGCVFYNHSDEECVAKYNRRVEDVIGVRATERLRAKLAM